MVVFNNFEQIVNFVIFLRGMMPSGLWEIDHCIRKTKNYID